MQTPPARTLFQRFAASFSRDQTPSYPPPPPITDVVAPPTVTWPDPVKSIRVGMTCPNCRSRARKPVKLTVNFVTPDHPMRHSRVLGCPDCTCLFYEDQNPPDYTEESMLGRGRTTFYLQQGAGVSLITRPLARIDRPAGSRYLEVGCGFGFGLDYAIRTKGWIGTGIDPAGLSAVGRDLLDVPIELRYLGDDEPAFTGTCDVVMASETIEHVPSPIAFVRTLKKALKPGGILILTTPNAAEIDPSKSQGVLVPLLSPGLHLVFQNEGSLRKLLDEAGFTQILQETDSVSLVAYASDAPFTLESDVGVLREAYRAHLETRARGVPPDGDLFYAFAGRALQESSNDGDWARAERAYGLLRDGCHARFGFDLDTMTSLPAEAASCSLERLAEMMPLNLGGILFADGMRKLAVGEPPRATLGPRFACAAAAADAMRRALGELAMEDGMSEAIAWAARAEGLLCDAAAGKDDVAAGLTALAPAPPGGDQGAARKREIVERALAWAVNAGHVAMGRRLAEATGLQAAAWANPGLDDVAPPRLRASQRDALFSLAVLDSQADGGGDPARGHRRFNGLRRMLIGHGMGDASPDFALQIVRGEVQALGVVDDRVAQLATIEEAVAGWPDLREADIADLQAQAGRIRDQGERDPLDAKRHAFVSAVNRADFPAAQPLAADLEADAEGEGLLAASQRDAVFALGVLNVQPGGDAAKAERCFARVRDTITADGQPTDLLWAAVRGEVQAVNLLRGQAASEVRRRSIMAGLGTEAETAPDDLRVAGVAVADGVPEDIDAARIRRSFVALVNAGDYAGARPAAAEIERLDAARRRDSPLSVNERDALFALGVLNLQPGGKPKLALASLSRARVALTPAGGQAPAALFWAALRGEIQATAAVMNAKAADQLRLRVLAEVGRPATEVPADLIAPGDAEQERLCAEFVGLVQAGQYEAAQPLGRQVVNLAFVSAGQGALSEPQRETLYALGVLAVQTERNVARAPGWFARVREQLGRPARGSAAFDLLASAMQGEVRAIEMSKNRDAAEAHRRALTASLGADAEALPEDLRAPLADGPGRRPRWFR